MKNISVVHDNSQWLKSVVYLGFGLALLFAMTARADDRDGHGRGGGNAQQNRGHHPQHQDRGWNDHEEHAHRYWNQPYFQPEPSVVYAPPLIYSAPPVYEEPGISLIFPLHIH